MSAITHTTFDFLTALKNNNHKEWFTANKSIYEQSQHEMAEFAQTVIDRMNQHDVIETPSGKKRLYRIYRDVRFSKDKKPYKSHWGGYLRRAGAERRGGYHFSISPGGSYISGGFFGPNKNDLLQFRKQINADASSLKKILNDKGFNSYFGQLAGEKLKTAPKGFSRDADNIELLCHKQFYVKHHFEDREVLSVDFAQKLSDGFLKMMPFFDVMTDYLLTDLNGEPMAV